MRMIDLERCWAQQEAHYKAEIARFKTCLRELADNTEGLRDIAEIEDYRSPREIDRIDRLIAEARRLAGE